MGKVYDALQRAEAERGRRTGQAKSQPTPLNLDVAAGSPADSGPGRLRAWMTRNRRSVLAENAASVNKRRITLLQPDSFVAEQFRTLRARLDSIAAQQPLKTVAVTSAIAGEGKSTSAINLALVTAMSVGRRVILVDCDLRKPRIGAALGVRAEAGLAEVLADQASLDQAIVKMEGVSLEILPVNNRPTNPSELLGSDRMRALVEELAQTYDRVILDLPATLGLPDVKIVSELADGVLLVVRAGVTPDAEVQAALDVLDRRRVLGVVLNGTVSDEERYGYSD